MQSKAAKSAVLTRSHDKTAGTIMRPKLRSKLVDVVMDDDDNEDQKVNDNYVNVGHSTTVFVQPREDGDASALRSSLSTLVTGLSFLRLNDGTDVTTQSADRQAVEDQIRRLCQTSKLCTEAGLKTLHLVLESLTVRTKQMSALDVDEGVVGPAHDARDLCKEVQDRNINAVRLARTAIAAMACVHAFASLLSEGRVTTTLPVPIPKSIAAQVVLTLDYIETAIARLTKAWYDNGRPDQGLAASARRTVVTVRSARTEVLNTSTVTPMDIEHTRVENDRAKAETIGIQMKSTGSRAAPRVKPAVKPAVEHAKGCTVRRTVAPIVTAKPVQRAILCEPPPKSLAKRAKVKFSTDIVSASHDSNIPHATVRALFEDHGLAGADEAALEGIEERASSLTFGSFHALYGIIRMVVLRLEREANRRESIAIQTAGTSGNVTENGGDEGNREVPTAHRGVAKTRAMDGTTIGAAEDEDGVSETNADQVLLAYSDKKVFSWLLRGMPPASKILKRRLSTANSGAFTDHRNAKMRHERPSGTIDD